MADIPVDEELLEDLYTWVDQVPLSRPKKDIKRDFADGVQVAEIIKFYLPNLVEVHNYPAAHKLDSKLTNWHTLNRKVFKKLGFEIGDDVIKNICNCKPWAVEQFLMLLRRKIDRTLYETQRDTKPKPSPVYDPRTEADRAYNKGGRRSNEGHTSPVRAHMRKTDSLQDLQRVGPGPTNYHSPGVVAGAGPSPVRQARAGGPGGPGGNGPGRVGEMVPKIVVEEKEQELLAKEETIQILQAKIRRLEHLLHLKDIRIDDLQHRVDNLDTKLRPTANYNKR